jgi:hypothetical protein
MVWRGRPRPRLCSEVARNVSRAYDAGWKGFYPASFWLHNAGNIELMDSARFENANKLHNAGHIEDAAREFHALADETDDPDEKAAIFANEHKCYCQLGWLDKANALMRQIRSLPHQDKFVRMIVDFADACMMAQMAKLDEGR